ncbi:hypothetical protein ZIOFF_020809 [Zingiber officinale]|uniref:rRNA-processing protein FYV7 n=1 Tax=Zingiber officinale TaxID=94328 RepID=A0A8J5H0V3_ZINOF|nr:hypothetical protein ZIOFF_020809 [Zingiber officinale]
MQKRANRDGGYGWRKKATDRKDRLRKRNEQRLGGKGLSLEAFANAKSRSSSVYNPALITDSPAFAVLHLLLAARDHCTSLPYHCTSLPYRLMSPSTLSLLVKPATSSSPIDTQVYASSSRAKMRRDGISMEEKQREFYRNAKLVNKYKKEVKQENVSSQHLPTTLDDEEDQTENQQMQSKTKKKTFRSLKEEYEKKHAEDEKARIEREAIIQAKNEEKAKNEAKRKAQREKMFKKTRFGQPVMKYRIEHILEGLLESSKKRHSRKGV